MGREALLLLRCLLLLLLLVVLRLRAVLWRQVRYLI
jgi:hypothetical protein